MALTKIPSSLLDTSGGFDLQGNITLGDNEQIQLGADGDLAIYHDGSNSYIAENGTGDLYIKATNLILGESAGEQYLVAYANGSVTLYHDNNPKITTSSTGATVTGTLTVTGDLDITGNVNSYNVTDLDVTDQTITLGAGQTEANSGGSGIIIDGSNASLLWNETSNRFDLSNDLKVGAEDGGQFSLEVSGGATGTAEGGELRLNTAADYDGTYNHYRLDVYEDDLRIGRAGTTDFYIFQDGLVKAENDFTVGGGLSVENGKLTINEFTGANAYTQIRKTNTGSNLAVVSQESIYMLLDENNDQTNRAFFIEHGAGSPGSGTTVFKVEESGNVGIGTSTPAKNLEIFGSGSESGILVKNDTNTNYRGYYISSVESDNTAYGKLHMDVNSGELNITSGYSGWGGFITFDTNGTQRMHINTNGEISMGWASGGGPGGGTLQVNGQGMFTNGGAGYVQGSILLRSSNNDETPSYRGQGVFTWNVGHQVSWFMGTPYTDGDLFTINRKSSESSFTQESSYIGHSNTNNFFTIKNNGCVGLGSVNPTESLYVGNINAGGADVSLALQNTISNRISSLKIYDESGNNKVNLNYDNGSNRGTLSMGDADGEIIYLYDGSSIKSGFGIDLSGSSRELSIFHTSSGTDGNIALGKRLESNGTFYETVQVTPAGTAGTANLIVHNVNSNSFNHVQENKVPNLTAGEDIFLGLGKSTNTKNMGYLGYEWNASGSDSNYIHLSHWGADGLFRVYGNGNYSFSGSNVSDRDLKENIVAITDTALDKVTQLVVKKFNFIKDYEVSSDGTEVETPRTQVGFIAQEVEAIIPDITVGTDGQKDMGVDTVGLVGYLTKAIQEQQEQIETLKQEIREIREGG